MIYEPRWSNNAHCGELGKLYIFKLVLFLCPCLLTLTTRMDSTSASHFGFISGVLGFVLAVTSASACCRGCFPSVQMKILDELLRETRQIYEQADSENIFPSDFFRKISKSMLVRCVEKSILCF